jgi:hypothetical protein
MSKPADPALNALAEQNDLGAFRARYAIYSEAYKKGLWLLGSALFLPGAYALSILRPGQVPLWALLGAALLGLAGLIMGSTLLYPLPFIKLQTYERGFIYKSHKGIEVAAYSEVIGVQARVLTTTTRSDGDSSSSRSGQLVAYLRDGRQVSVNPNLEDVNAFMDELTQGAAPSVIAEASSAVKAGKTFSCGAITLAPDGLTVAGRTHSYKSKPRVKVEFDETRVFANDNEVAKLKTKDVINGPYMEHVIKAAKATQVPDNNVRVDLEVVAAHQALDAAVIKAIKSIAPPEWPVVVVEFGVSRGLDNLVVMDKSGAAMLPPNAELMDVGGKVAEIHSRHRTGANRVRLELKKESGGWSVGSQFLKIN